MKHHVVVEEVHGKISHDTRIGPQRDIGEELSIPVFLYEAAATRPERASLAEVRRGEFEGLRDRIGRDPARRPDFGPERIHPTAGATAVGARRFLVAFNANLNTGDVRVAKAVAAAIREQSGGLKNVRALGFSIEGGRRAHPFHWAGFYLVAGRR